MPIIQKIKQKTKNISVKKKKRGFNMWQFQNIIFSVNSSASAGINLENSN